MRVPNITISNLKTLSDVIRYASNTFTAVASAINGGLSFQENIQGRFSSVEFRVANQEVSFEHSLSSLPRGFLVTGLSASMVVYNGVTENTNQVMYLRASAPGTATVFVF